ncbi:hypothetical protein X798_05233 [Onchocerca flexuosa]|uniref:Uncharacterized protein n=2 Tax=Onchocerca flexuosa TaxID=387005 RepID=A0A183H528_9BILA|nr:hypothetical protein X798_05233 [Onchocerca flexuosa]VDO33511.1 unnamed protein product [Onchocerca flexuosa]
MNTICSYTLLDVRVPTRLTSYDARQRRMHACVCSTERREKHRGGPGILTAFSNPSETVVVLTIPKFGQV